MSDTTDKASIGPALGRIPAGLFILTAQYEERATGILASWVQQACFEPPMVSVAIAKGRPVMSLVSESRCFGLCQLPQDEKIIMRKFASGVDASEDPFLGFEMVTQTVLNVPILAHVMGYLECELTSHLDVDGDHDLFVGEVKAGAFVDGEPWIHVRDNGFKY